MSPIEYLHIALFRCSLCDDFSRGARGEKTGPTLYQEAVREKAFFLKLRHFKIIGAALYLISESTLTCEYYFSQNNEELGKRASRTAT